MHQTNDSESQIAFVTGADRGLGLGIARELLSQGWRVYAGRFMERWHEFDALAYRYPEALTALPLDVSSTESARAAAEAVAAREERVDLLVNNAGVIFPSVDDDIRIQQNYADMHRMFDVNALGPLRVIEAFLPLVQRSKLRRLCIVSSEAGSVEASTRGAWFGYCMSKTAVNMAVKNLFNDLRPQGFSFRLYHPGWVRSYMSGEKNTEAKLEPEEAGRFAVTHFLGGVDDEDRLRLVDYEGKEWPW